MEAGVLLINPPHLLQLAHRSADTSCIPLQSKMLQKKGNTESQKVALIQIYLREEEGKKPVMKTSRSDSRHTGVAAHAA